MLMIKQILLIVPYISL